MKQRIINWLLSKVVMVTIPDDIIREERGVIYLGKEPLGDIELRNLISEAKALEKMRMWSIMNETVKQIVYERGWKNSKTMEELNVAKAEYHILDLQQSILRAIKSKSR